MILEKIMQLFSFYLFINVYYRNDNVWLILFDFSYRENIIRMKINLN